MSLYRLHSIFVDTTDLPVSRVGCAAGGEIRAEPSSETAFSHFSALVAATPRLEFDTPAINRALGVCALAGVDIGQLTNGLIVWMAKMDGNGIAAGAAHRKLTIKSGVLVPRTLTCASNTDASLSYEAVITYDGTNSPIAIQDGQNLPGLQMDNDKYSLGPITLESIAFGDVESLTIDFGIGVETKSPDSYIWPKRATIQTTVPKLSLKGDDPEWFKSTAIPIDGKAITHANTKLYLRKRDGQGFEPNGNSVHTKFTAAGTAHIPNPFSAGLAEAGETDLECVCHEDTNNNDPIIPTPNTAIS